MGLEKSAVQLNKKTHLKARPEATDENSSAVRAASGLTEEPTSEQAYQLDSRNLESGTATPP